MDGLKLRLSKKEPQHVGASFVALRYSYNDVCSFQTSSSHNSDSSGGSANNSWSMSACTGACGYVNCNWDVIAFWMIVSIM